MHSETIYQILHCKSVSAGPKSFTEHYTNLYSQSMFYISRDGLQMPEASNPIHSAILNLGNKYLQE